MFSKIIRKEIPADIVFEDETTLAFRDISPVASIHVLIIPKKTLGGVSVMKEDDVESVGRCILTAKKVAEELGVSRDGYRLVINEV